MRNYMPAFIGVVLYAGFLLLVISPDLGQAYQPYTPTPTIVPADASLADWAEIMSPDPECQLPCWWGITPGLTLESEVETVLNARFQGVRVRKFLENDPLKNTLLAENFLAIVQGGNPIPIAVLKINASDGIVSDIVVDSPSFNPANLFLPAWEFYSIENTINVFGIPDAIRITAYHTSLGIEGSYLMFIWRKWSVLAEYNRLSSQTANSTVQLNLPLCFDMSSLEAITLRLQSQNGTRDLEEIGEEGTAGSKDISVVTDYTNAEFTQILLDNGGCLPSDLPIFWDRTPSPNPTATPTLAP